MNHLLSCGANAVLAAGLLGRPDARRAARGARLGQIDVGHVFLLRLAPGFRRPLLRRTRIRAEIYAVVTTLEMNISAVNGKDEISWKTKNTTKNQFARLSILVRERTIQVPGKSLVSTGKVGIWMLHSHNFRECLHQINASAWLILR